MAVFYVCPKCQAALFAPAELPLGRVAACPTCRSPFTIGQPLLHPPLPIKSAAGLPPAPAIGGFPPPPTALQAPWGTQPAAQPSPAQPISALPAFGAFTPRGPAARRKSGESGEQKLAAYGMLGCVLPFATFLGSTIGLIWLFHDGSQVFGVITCGISLLLIAWALAVLQDRWTMSRGVWAGGVACLGLCVGGFVGFMQYQDMRRNETLQPVAAALLAEFQQPLRLGGGPSMPIRAGGVFPLVLNPRSERNPVPNPNPTADFSYENCLPDHLQLQSPTDEVHTVVLLDWGWKEDGVYINKLTGGIGGAYIGVLKITVVDRKTRAVIARTTIESPNKPPEEKRTAMAWYGSQPDIYEINQFLRKLPVK